jgi:predicted nucleic acid-binding protein
MVVADTSPLHYLVLVQVIEILPSLFHQVLIPEEVHRELLQEKTPTAVRSWVADPPSWLEIVGVDWTVPRTIPDLDVGETAAILLAEQQGPNTFLLMDDAKGRREATKRGLASAGTLGVLRLREVMPRLLRTNFYASEELIQVLLSEEDV